MINNQIEFNKQFTKEIAEIKLKRKEFKDNFLTIEQYPNLEILNLRDVKNIKKIILKNLTKLKETTIWDCGMNDLVINNCPQIKKLIVRTNSLTNLDFLTILDNLEELDIEGNEKLIELLKPYNSDWKAWKEVQKISKENPEELAKRLWDLQIENKKLTELKDKTSITPSNSEDFEYKYQKLKGVLDSLLSKAEELKTAEIRTIKTKDLTDTLSGKMSDQEISISELQENNKELEEKVRIYEADKDRIIQKEKQLEELKKTITANNPKIIDDLEELLEAQQENNQKWLVRIKKRLSKQINDEQINNLCKIQKKLAQLKNNIHQQEQQINQIINNYYGNISQSIVGVEGNVTMKDFAPHYQAQIEQSIK